MILSDNLDDDAYAVFAISAVERFFFSRIAAEIPSAGLITFRSEFRAIEPPRDLPVSSNARWTSFRHHYRQTTYTKARFLRLRHGRDATVGLRQPVDISSKHVEWYAIT